MKGPKVPRQSTCSVFRTSWSKIACTLNGEQNQLPRSLFLSFLFFLRIEFCVIAAEIKRLRIRVILYIGKYVELNLIKLPDQNNSRTCSLTKSSKVCGLKSYENIYSPYVFVCLKPSLLPSISVHFQEQSSSSHVFTCRQLRCFEM